MAIHHLALAVRDIAASHRFYTEAMGFRLVHAQAGVTDDPSGAGWARHLFYDTDGGTLLALWDLHDPRIEVVGGALIGTLPSWVNHVAFDAGDRRGLDTRTDRWLALGLDVLRIDHGWTMSAYTDDPDGNMIEWCSTTKRFGTEQATAALHLLADPSPSLDPLPSDIEFLRPVNREGSNIVP